MEPVKGRDEAPGSDAARFASPRAFYAWAAARIVATGRYWLFPVLLLLVVFGFFLNVFTGHNVLPAIYSLMP